MPLTRYRRDSTIYQDMTDIEILEAIFKGGTGEGAYGRTARVFSAKSEAINVLVGDGEGIIHLETYGRNECGCEHSHEEDV